MSSTHTSERARQVVAAAREILEAEGMEGLSMRRLADSLGIRAPSIYKHLPDKQALENALIAQGFEEMAAAFAHALRTDSADTVSVLGRVYRDFAQQHPHMYRLMTERPLDRTKLKPGVEDAAARPLVDALGGDPDLARAVFGFVHGMAILELNGRFPPGADLDSAWSRGLRALASQARVTDSNRSQKRATKSRGPSRGGP